MSNPIYYVCGKCDCLMNEQNEDIVCPNCENKFFIDDGSDFPDMDDKDYNDGFRRGVKH